MKLKIITSISHARIFCVLLVLWFVAFAEKKNSRFFRILKQYENPTYFITDRDIVSEFDYYSHSDERKADTLGLSEDYDDVSTFERNFSNKTGFESEKYSGKPLKAHAFAIGAGINGSYDKESELRENKLIQKSDICEYLDKFGGVYCDATWDFERYKRRKRKGKKYRFYGWDFIADNYFRYQQEHRYEDYELTDNWAYSRFETKYEGVARGTISPKIGFGKPLPYTSLFKAFQIERILKKSGVIKKDLSDSTMISLAQWLNTEFVYRARNDRPDKFFYAALDSVLIQDEAYDSTSMNPYACMHVKEMVDLPYEYLEKGIQVYLSLNQSVELSYKRRKKEVNGVAERPTGGFGLDYDQAPYSLGIVVESGLPVNPRLFFDISALYILAAGKSISTYNSDEYFLVGDSTIDYLTRIIWDASVHFWIHERLIITGEMRDLDATIILPRKWPEYLGVSLEYFIADHMTLLLSFKKYYSYYHYDHIDTKSYVERISLGLRYDF